MNFPSIDIQGSILSTDLLAKIRSEQATFQQGKDFNPDLTNPKLKDEISLAWQEAKGQWTIFKSKLSRLKEGETGTTETRNFWISPLLTNLSYNLTFDRKGEELNGKTFPIGYRDSSLDNFPLYVGGYNESLDKRPENKQLRVSPHAMLQEYLNYSEHLYGVVTNGRQLRLLRDASRITRLSYLEFNLEKMMEEDLYSDFVILYRLLHASRMPKRVDSGAESIIEKYHQEGLEAGSTIRNKLGEAVKGAIKNLANGFLNHPNNAALRAAVAAGNINVDEYYRHQLRVIYRLLFLFVIEERNLVYADSKTPETKRFNQIYFNYYSLLRLRKLAKKLLPPEAHRHYDIWQSLISTFSLFEKKEIGEKLGIMSLQGDLFGYNAISNNQYDLHQCYLSNDVLLNIIKSLSYFENDNKVLIAVNYGGLDVEEFGSVYEGLLELKLEFNKIEGSENYSVNWKKQAGGREFQSHYTPEELVQPLIKHSLEYLIEDILLLYSQKKVSKDNTIKALLKLKVCDVACGSGHILLSAARRIALAVARVQTDEDQPNPLSIRKAMKDVVRNCIYGVDKNPLAIELCKIALWLEAYNPGEPLNFLDHHIKCGDAIVGLAHRSELENGIADEAFKTLPGDEKDIAKTYRDKNVKERKERVAKSVQLKAEFEKTTENSVQEAMAEYKTFNHLPETTPEETERKAKAYKKFIDGKGFTFLRAMADTQVAQFFIPKSDANKDSLMTDGDFRLILSGYKGWQDRKVAKATAMALENRFFHWFIEFPEVFDDGGFDCVLGNPPFLGGQKLSTNFGTTYLNFIHSYFIGTKGTADLVAYFFRRIYSMLGQNGFQSLITTNTISQGDTREGSLEIIIKNNGKIIFANRNIKWPGVAAVEISEISITKSNLIRTCYLNGKKVLTISAYLDDTEFAKNPYVLFSNQDFSFVGSYILGKGFIIESDTVKKLIHNNEINSEVIFKYIVGDDINNNPDQTPSRWVINFFDWEEIKVKSYIECYQILEAHVKPERQRWAQDSNGKEIVGKYALRKPLPEKWWIYGEKRPKLYSTIKNHQSVIAVSRVTKYLGFSFVDANCVLSEATIVFTFKSKMEFAFLVNSFHEYWAWKYGSTMGSSTLRYSPSDCFETFPFPQNLNTHQEQRLETIGEAYHEHRKQLMLGMQLGLTKTYNLFHSNAITAQSINEKDKQVLALQKHLDKIANTISFAQAIEGILKLRELHIQMDTAVLDAYGWNDIQLRHDFYEVDYLPENDRVRFTIHPDARKEVLKRLLGLNHKIHEEEVEQGLWDKKKTKGLNSNKQNTSKSDDVVLSQTSLFNTDLNIGMKEFNLNEGIYSIGDASSIIKQPVDRVRRWFKKLVEIDYEGLDGSSKIDIEKRRISFHGLIELVVIGTLLENGFSIKSIIKARNDLKLKSGKDLYPFATNNVKDKLKVAGSFILFEFPNGTVTLDGTGQYNLEIINQFFKDIIFENDIAMRLVPLSGKGKILIDPKVAGGRPSFKDHPDVQVETMLRFYNGADSIDDLMLDYNLSREDIEAALNYN